MLGTSKSIWGFDPRSVPGCTLWLDASDTATMNTTPTVTVWKDKSGQSNDVTGTATATGGTMTFNGSTQAFSNTGYVFPISAYSMFAVYSNTTAPASTAYMNAVYGSNGYPMLGVYDVNKYVSARSVVANTGALTAAVNPGWAAQITGTTTSQDLGYGIATDSSGNVLVTGQYNAAVTLYNQGPSGTAGTTLPFTGGTDCFIAKYSSAGAVVWAARIAGTTTSQDIGRAIATDLSGNVFVTGEYSAALTLYNQGPSGTAGTTLPWTNGTDCFIAKYSSAGAVVWAARIAGTAGHIGYGIATDSGGNVFVTGLYAAALTVYNQGPSGTAGTTLPFTGGVDCFVAKYSSAGAVVWAAQIAGTTTSDDRGFGIATDLSGNVLVTGQYTADLTVYNQGPSGTAGTTLSNAGGFDCFVAKYSSAGDVVWAARIASTGAVNDIGFGIATDSSGNVLVTGQYSAALTVYNQGPSGTTGTTLPWTGGVACFIAKYSSAGDVVWAARIASTSAANTFGRAIATDSSGNVLVTGWSDAVVLTVYNQGPSGTAGTTLSTNAGLYDCFVAKYSSAGAVVWAARIASINYDQGNAIATDSSGNVFVTGYYSNALTVYNQGPSGTAGTTLPFTGGTDVFIVKYNPDGYITNAPTPANSNVLVDVTYTPSTMSPFVNGNAQTTLAGTTSATTGIYIGGPSNYFNGSISELLVYGVTLTPNQRQAVEGYLAYKWGTRTALITTHPFYTLPAFNRSFNPTDIPGCSLWLDAADGSSMNSTTTVTSWSDKSGLGNTMTGTATWTGSNMSFNGSTQAFSNTTYVFPNSAYSMFAVYSNTTAPASTAYMNVMYGSNGYPMLGVYDVNKNVTARSVVANTGALGTTVGWAARIAGTTTSAEVGQAIATDSSGNVLVTGYYAAALTVYNQGAAGTAGATLPLTGGGNDCFIAKYSSAGAVVWAARIASTGVVNDIGQAIATDSSGNVLVTGYYGAALTVYNQGAAGTAGATLPWTGAEDCFIAKYSSAGAVVWAARIASAGNERGYAIATDSSGNVLVTGFYGAALTVYNQGAAGTAGATLPFTGGNDCFVAKYSSAGAVVWAARIAGTTTSQDLGYGIATDSSGNVLVTGNYTAALTVYNQGAAGTAGATLPWTGAEDCFIAKYSSAGAVVWAARIAGTTTSSDIGQAIATDSSDNVLVTGVYRAALTVYNQGAAGTAGATLPFTGGSDVFIAKYSSAGAVVWAARIAGTTFDSGNGIATDSSGNVLVTGFYDAALTVYNQGPSGTAGATLPFTGGNDCFIAKYSSAGAVVWAARIASTGAGYDVGNGIATDSSGNVLVTGVYGAALTVYNQGAAGTAGATLPYVGGVDCFVVKYNPDGYITAPVPASSNVLVDVTYTPSTFSPFVNGFTATTLAGTTLAATGIFVGGPTNYFNGSISEVLIYASNLSADRRQQVEGYLTQKWRLNSQIVTGHPYKLIPPATPQPAQYAEVTPGNWTRDWQPYLKSLAAANASGVTVTTTNITGGATYNSGGGWSGGVVGPDGNIYFAPHVAANILKLTVSTGVTTNITGGATYTSSGWMGGVLGPDGNIYFCPWVATNILRLNVATGVTTNITGGATYSTFGWWGGVLGPDGNIYFTPYNALNILRLNVVTGVTTNITGGASFQAAGRLGGVLGPDGNVYITPYTATSMIKLNVTTGVTTNITGGGTYNTGGGWQGGVLGIDGCIYCAPYNGTNILKLNVSTGITTNITGGATYPAPNSSAWRGGVLGPDGNIYFTPAGVLNILRLNVATGVTTIITGGATYIASGWNGGGVLGPDGNIYLPPYTATNILKITFSGLSQLPSLNYCASTYNSKF